MMVAVGENVSFLTQEDIHTYVYNVDDFLLFKCERNILFKMMKTHVG